MIEFTFPLSFRFILWLSIAFNHWKRKDTLYKSVVIEFIGALETIWTPDFFLRREALYPAELQAQKESFYLLKNSRISL